VHTLQVALFVLAVLAFVGAVFFIGDDTGDVLWRAGIAVSLIDIACVKVWPAKPSS
jgi:hypothetical protein